MFLRLSYVGSISRINSSPSPSPPGSSINGRLRAVDHPGRAIGPGPRAVVWFQCCTMDCPDCFNPATHNALADCEADIESFGAKILSLGSGIEGLSLSGSQLVHRHA